MASTWTKEQTAKYDAACKEAYASGSPMVGTTDFWDYIAKKVGDGKTAKDVKDKFDQANKELFGDAHLFLRNEKPVESKLEKVASTWTEEESRKFGVAFDQAYNEAYGLGSFDFDSTEFWDYIAKKVGSGKTVADCKDKYLKKLTDERKDKK